MDKYHVVIRTRAYRDINKIYSYIANEIQEIETAENIADIIEETILSLEDLPYRGAERKTGSFANKGYRNIFVKNFTIIYRIEEKKKEVVIVTAKYSHSMF